MNNFMQKLYNFMYGRYGFDKLTGFLILLNLLLNGIGSFMRNRIAYYIFYFAALAIFCFAVFRVLSKNIEKRRREGDWFDRMLVRTNYTDNVRKMKRWFRVCPNCKENLRLSKKRGKRNVTCPICGNKFTVHILF